MPKMEGLPKKGIIENIKKAAQIGVLVASGVTGVSSHSEAQNTVLDTDLKNQTEINKDTKGLEIKKINPEDYDLKKIGALDLRDLDAKKSLDAEAINRIMMEGLIRSKIDDIIDSSLMNFDMVSHSVRSITRQIESAKKEENVSTRELEDKLVEANEKKEAARLKVQENFKLHEKINNNEFNKIDVQISESEKAELESKAHSMVSEIETARREAMRMIGDKSYLDKIQKEFNCSKEEAINHQKVRLSNLDIINYILVSNKTIASYLHNSLAYATIGSNVITLPYDNSSAVKLSEMALHEFLHLATNGNSGLSPLAKSLLSSKSMKENSGEKVLNKKDYDYVSDPTERYVRFKILESDLENHNVKKIGESFTMDHYKKMMALWESGILYHGSSDFLEYTKGMKDRNIYKKMMDFYGVSNDKLIKNDEEGYSIFKELFDSIASIDNSNKKDENNEYIHPGWDYNTKPNQA